MSTKVTLAHSHEAPSFHFYEECLDGENVYLELRGADIEFEASANRVMVRIPNEVWEAIRHKGAPDLQYAEWSDEDVEAHVGERVDKRIAGYQKCKEDVRKGLIRLVGSTLYGYPSDPRESQMTMGTTHFRYLRDKQLAMKKRIETLRKANENVGE